MDDSRSRCSRAARSCRRSTASTPPRRARSRHSWATPYYWADKEPAFKWFATIPFGMNPDGIATWYYQGDGLKLGRRRTARSTSSAPGVATGPQMAGWFRKKINTIADYKGLKMRIPGLGGKVVAKAGGTVVLTPGSEIYAALERGVIDASEWVGPHDDMKLGLHNTARYYYYPGWHEPGTVTSSASTEGVRGAARRPPTHARPCRHGDPGVRTHRIRGEEHHRAGETQDRVQGQGRDPPAARCRCCEISRSSRRRSSRRNRRRAHG